MVSSSRLAKFFPTQAQAPKEKGKKASSARATSAADTLFKPIDTCSFNYHLGPALQTHDCLCQTTHRLPRFI